MKKPNKFITFEGVEGAGKTTVSNLVKEKLETQGFQVFLTREPGGKDVKFAEDIRKVIMDHEDIDPITELFLFNASRREHTIKKIRKHLEKGELVISDRFVDSTIVYQGIDNLINKETILSINNIAVGETKPDFVFILDLDPIVGIKRISTNKRETNRFDNKNIEFHKKIRKGYQKLAEDDPEKYIILDANLSPGELSDMVIEVLKNG